MTLPHNARPLRSFAITAIAGLMTLATFGATVSPANAAGGVYYRAELATPVESTKEVVGGILWVCEGTSCIAGKGGARPASMCKRVAREFGDLTSFTAGSKELAADKIAKCNGN
ncbi:hypothetical protein [Altererythrobacter sp. ZODW24]|uniref:CC_3452 family protein n=1 Tax=Altererythrobacter sp. ZODW24 TaxID=2185142 RepID=UPI000DF76D9E|nr:hypothetical protein [Altererythrobacter sp. ZODW24]